MGLSKSNPTHIYSKRNNLREREKREREKREESESESGNCFLQLKGPYSNFHGNCFLHHITAPNYRGKDKKP